jgi:hypothetical protein
MKTNKTTHETPYHSNTQQLVKKYLPFAENVRLSLCLAIVMGIGFGFETATVKAENTEALDIQHYKEPQRVSNTTGKSIQNTKVSNALTNIEVTKTIQEEEAMKSSTGGTPENTDQAAIKAPSTEKCSGAEKTSSGDSPQQSQINTTIEPVGKSDDGKGKLPTFAQADVNGDHFVTKLELQNFPYLLQVFDKVDAGNDGQLEQHEYQNLKMETKREGEIS